MDDSNKKLSLSKEISEPEEEWEDDLPPPLSEKKVREWLEQPDPPPPNRWKQYSQVIHVLETWDSRVAHLARMISEIKSEAQKAFLTSKRMKYQEFGTTEIDSLREKHYRIDKSLEDWCLLTTEGLKGAYLIGEHETADREISDEDLLKLWERTNYHDQALSGCLLWTLGVLKQQARKNIASSSKPAPPQGRTPDSKPDSEITKDTASKLRVTKLD
ncbi:MAG: hypothetical protein LBE31_10350 [Deltaproteobacteria bacterium]|jgi:hypothetical protein|nr:hypothetical protein [Deltaproteobacteria bacterium]